MKKTFFLMLCALLCFVLGALAQNEKTIGFQIEVDAIHSRSGLEHYYSNWGGEMYLNRIINRHRIGFGLGSVYYGGEFTDTKYSNFDPSTPIFQHTKCRNKWFCMKLNYAYSIYDSEHSAIYVSPFVSLNYFILNENGRRNGAFYEYNKKYNNKFGFGIALEYEVKFNAFSTSIKLAPDCMLVDNIMVGVNMDAFYRVFNLGTSITMKYTFGK